METQDGPVDVVMARAKIIYILIIRVNKFLSFFSSRCFLKETENMYSVFLSSYRNTSESLGEREMLWDSFFEFSQTFTKKRKCKGLSLSNDISYFQTIL